MNFRNFSFLGLSYFAVLLNYPLIRASTTTLFVEAYGAKAAPQGWLLAVGLLIVTVALVNHCQSRFGFHRTFLGASLVTGLIFILGDGFYAQGARWWALVMFAWKEIYIVLQVHLLLAYANAWLPKADFLRWIGPLGALGSLGGIAGGLLTSWVAEQAGMSTTLFLGVGFIVLPGVLSWQLTEAAMMAPQSAATSPLKSLDTPVLKRYVVYLAAIVALSQIVINIADFQFGLLFESSLADRGERTAYLGRVFAATNAVTLVLQLLVLPVLLRLVGERALHLFIPLSYLLCLTFGLAGASLMASALFFIYLKASDYSLFSAGKEILYHPLAPQQKFGAKYLTDMFVYRAAKAGIAAVLIYFQSPRMLIGMTVLALLAWLVLAVLTLSHYRRHFT